MSKSKNVVFGLCLAATFVTAEPARPAKVLPEKSEVTHLSVQFAIGGDVGPLKLASEREAAANGLRQTLVYEP